MTINLIDFIVLGLITLGVRRGARRGFPAEFPSLVGVLLVLVAGGGMFHVTEQLLTDVTRTAGLRSGPVSFFTVLIGAFFLVRHFRKQLRAWAERLTPAAEPQRRWGQLAGGGRWFAVCALVILLSSLIPIGEFRKPFTRGSAFGRAVVRVIRPVYRASRTPPPATAEPAPTSP